MKYILCASYDAGTKEYGNPVTANTPLSASTVWLRQMKKEAVEFIDELSLYMLGTYETESGHITVLEAPIQICKGTEILVDFDEDGFLA